MKSESGEDRQARLDLKLRENRGRSIAPGLAARVARIIGARGVATTFLDLTATDTARDEAGTTLRDRERTTRAVFSKNDLGTALNRLRAALGPDEDSLVYILHSNDRFTGALQLPAGTTAEFARQLYELFSNDLVVMRADMNGVACLSLEHTRDDGSFDDEGVVELYLYGVYRDRRTEL
jgi:hypothetical protein